MRCASSPELRSLTATRAPSAAKPSAISRPTPLVAPVTNAIFPFSAKSMFALSCFCFASGRRDEPEQTLLRQRKLVNFNPEGRKRVGDCIRYRGRCANSAAFAHAAKAAERGRRDAFDVHDVHPRDLKRCGHEVIDKTSGGALSLLVVDQLFVKRRANPLRYAAMDLAVDDHRIDQLAAILCNGELLGPHLESVRVDVNRGDVRR